MAEIIFLLLAGPCIGSFAGAMASRLAANHAGMSAFNALSPSACDHCGRRLAPQDLVPVVSWLVQRGRTRCCGHTIDPVYPMLESLGFVVVALALVFSSTPVHALLLSLLGLALLVAAAIDLKTYRLPDMITLPTLVAGVCAASLHGIESIAAASLGAIAGYLFLAGVAALYRRIRAADGLGLGDAKLFAAGGAWLGWEGLAPALLIGTSVTVLALTLWAFWSKASLDGKVAVPFGPGLAVGIFTAALGGFHP